MLLPLSGCEIKDVVPLDLADADAKIQIFTGYYFKKPLDRINPFTVINAFWGWNVNYNGRPDNASSPTSRLINQLDDRKDWEGLGGACTWFGVPTRVAKVTNFFTAYIMVKCGIQKWIRDISSKLGGTENDASADISWKAGEQVAYGGDYYSIMPTKVAGMWNSVTDDLKLKTLWPNYMIPDNYVPKISPLASDYNNFFSRPNFCNFDTATAHH